MFMEIDYPELGKKIRALREAQRPKVSREGLAEHVDVSSTSVYRWENGLDKPGLEHLLKVAAFFKVDLEYLINVPGAGTKLNVLTKLLSTLPALDEGQLSQLLRLAEIHISGGGTKHGDVSAHQLVNKSKRFK